MTGGSGLPTDQTPDDIDLAALREKYRAGARQAVASEGSKQYVEARRRLRGVLRDRSRTRRRWSATRSRKTSTSPSSAAASAALLCGAYLKKAGVDDVRIIELGGDFGGVWYWNRYPGHPVRQRIVLLHTAARRAELHAVEEVRRRRRDLRALPAHRKALRPLRFRDLLHPGPRVALGRDRSSAGGSAPTAATTSGPASW